MTTRIEKDALGEVPVPAHRLWGAQTQRSVDNFPIGISRFAFGRPVVRAFGLVKQASARANAELGVLPREVLLPCERFDACVLVISTYGQRSNWIRNILRHPEVQVTCAGRTLAGRAEIVAALDRKQALVSARPFFVPFPTHFLNVLHRTLLRPLWVPFLRWWVRYRPVVIIHVGE